MTRRDETGFRHGLRVRMGGADGQRGQLLRCEKRDGSGHYWKVRLTDGRWVWPDDLILDGPGDHVEHCMECRLPFMGNVGDLLCKSCQEERFGTTAQRARDARDDSFLQKSTGTYHRRRSHS